MYSGISVTIYIMSNVARFREVSLDLMSCMTSLELNKNKGEVSTQVSGGDGTTIYFQWKIEGNDCFCFNFSVCKKASQNTELAYKVH